MNSADRLNYLNLGCMLGAAALALFLPLPLFLLSYAVLGPAHYLTEISWLHRRSYFTQQPRARWVLVGVGGGLALANLLLSTPAMTAAWLRPGLSGTIYVLTLGLATLALVQLPWPRTVLFTALLVITPFCPPLYLVVFLFLPTLVHVYLFTGSFLLLGTLRTPRPSGYLACLAFIACPVALVVLLPQLRGLSTAYAQDAYLAFRPLATALSRLLPVSTPTQALVLATRLIAWAYCYHYLNWFTKTRLIGWHTTGRLALLVLGLLWAGSVALYAWDYTTGLRWLYCLSLLHVLLELPLNRVTLSALTHKLFSPN